MDRLIIESSKIVDDLFTATYTLKVIDHYNKKNRPLRSVYQSITV